MTQVWVIAVAVVGSLLVAGALIKLMMNYYKSRRVSPLASPDAMVDGHVNSKLVVIDMPVIASPQPIHSPTTQSKRTSALISHSNVPIPDTSLSFHSTNPQDLCFMESDQDITLNESSGDSSSPSLDELDAMESSKRIQEMDKMLMDYSDSIIVARMELQETRIIESHYNEKDSHPHSRSTSNNSTLHDPSDSPSPPISPTLSSEDSTTSHLDEPTHLLSQETQHEILSPRQEMMEIDIESGLPCDTPLQAFYSYSPPPRQDSFTIQMNDSSLFDAIPDFQLSLDPIPLHPNRQDANPIILPRPRLLHIHSPIITSPLSPFATPSSCTPPRYYQHVSPRDTLHGAVLIKMATQTLYASQRERTALFEQQHHDESLSPSTSFCSTSLSSFVQDGYSIDYSRHDDSLYFDSDSSDEDSDDGVFDDRMDGAVLYHDW